MAPKLPNANHSNKVKNPHCFAIEILCEISSGIHTQNLWPGVVTAEVPNGVHLLRGLSLRVRKAPGVTAASVHTHGLDHSIPNWENWRTEGSCGPDGQRESLDHEFCPSVPTTRVSSQK